MKPGSGPIRRVDPRSEFSTTRSEVSLGISSPRFRILTWLTTTVLLGLFLTVPFGMKEETAARGGGSGGATGGGGGGEDLAD